MNPPAITLIIIAITALVSWRAFNDRRLMGQLILWPPAITRGGQVHRLVSYGLLHADLQHLLFNMFTLFFFGAMLERFFGAYIGQLGFVLFYVSALLFSALPSYMKHRNDTHYSSLGASGAVSAVLFAFILLQPWALIFIPIPVPAILYGVGYMGYTIYMERRGGDNINHSAHLWGAVYGMTFIVAMEPRVLTAFLAQLLQPEFNY